MSQQRTAREEKTVEKEEQPVLRARALLFDMDGTLVDSTANIERAYRWWAATHGLPLEPILAVQTGRPHREVMAEFHPGLDFEEESRLFTDFEVGDEEGMPLVPGVEAVLHCARQGRWAVVTSAKRSLAEMRFRITGLEFPDVLVTSDMVKNGKPNPESYLIAADLLGVPPGECVIFEDASAGVEAGRRAGIPVVGVNTSGNLTGVDLLIRDYNELILEQDGSEWFSIRLRPAA